MQRDGSVITNKRMGGREGLNRDDTLRQLFTSDGNQTPGLNSVDIKPIFRVVYVYLQGMSIQRLY